MANVIRSIELDKLVSCPDNPNRMSKANFGKLVRNIEKTGLYEPILVRAHPENENHFQIINGEHRYRALARLGYKDADCIVWDVDGEQADILLVTLNRLRGSDNLGKKLNLLRRINKRMESAELAKLVPQTAKQIERLTNLKMPSVSAEVNTKCFLNPMVFFVNDAQQKTIEDAISSAEKSQSGKTKALRRAAGLTRIAEGFLNQSNFNSRT
jgi:ParB/RepB/Spo0J family partition protein